MILFCFSENYLDNPSGLPSPPPSSNAIEEEDAAQATIRNWLLQFLGFSASEKRSALAQLVSLCDIGHIKQLRTAIEPYFQRDFMYLLPKEVTRYLLN